MKTKDRILKNALELFNCDGVKEVTLRKIAGSMGISQGNLNYHFKTKGDIISALYYRLVDELNIEMEKVVREQPILAFLYESSFLSMKILYAYKFITKDLYSVLNSDNQLKTHFLELQKLRKQQYLLLFQNLMKEDLMRREELKGEYERLYERLNILGDNWINAASLFVQESQSIVEYYHKLLFEVIYPYLTEKGKVQYLDLI